LVMFVCWSCGDGSAIEEVMGAVVGREGAVLSPPLLCNCTNRDSPCPALAAPQLWTRRGAGIIEETVRCCV
jgi:hypothetical protein